MDSNLIKIAKYYGYSKQSRQCIEEMAELTQAITKFRRRCDENKSSEINNSFINLVEELADVQIMIDQLKVLAGCDDFLEKIIKYKIERQLQRIEEEGAKDE